MKKAQTPSSRGSLNLLKEAAKNAIKDHGKKPEVIEFKKHFDEYVFEMWTAMNDGSYEQYIGYTESEKINSNGKHRHIDSPNLITRIYEHYVILLLKTIYDSKDPFFGLNCKPGCGITANDPKRSVVHKMKHLYYDCRNFSVMLFIDQRHCYDHMTVKLFRKVWKMLIVNDEWLLNFTIKTSFVRGKLPIGTPTSPFLHHLMMLPFDLYIKNICPKGLRYADDNALPFSSKEEANQVKWRVQNFWWYVYSIRAKTSSMKVLPFKCPEDFCGYIFHRNLDKAWNQTNKGYTTVRQRTADKAKKCDNDNSWASYFGHCKAADCYRLMQTIEQMRSLKELTKKIRIMRDEFEAQPITKEELVKEGATFVIKDFEIDDSESKPCIKLLLGSKIPMTKNKYKAYLLKGNYQSLMTFLKQVLEEECSKEELLPITDVEFEDNRGIIFKDSVNLITEFNLEL